MLHIFSVVYISIFLYLRAFWTKLCIISLSRVYPWLRGLGYTSLTVFLMGFFLWNVDNIFCDKLRWVFSLVWIALIAFLYKDWIISEVHIQVHLIVCIVCCLQNIHEILSRWLITRASTQHEFFLNIFNHF